MKRIGDRKDAKKVRNLDGLHNKRCGFNGYF